MDLGQNIAQLRTERGLLQKELAANLKVSVGTISNYEKGRHYPDPATLCKIAEFFGVTTDYLLGRTSFRYSPQLLFRPFTDNYSVEELLNISLQLTPQNKCALAEYVELLKLRQSSSSGNSSNP